MRQAKKPISIRRMLLSVFFLLMVLPLTVVASITYKKENDSFQSRVSQLILQTVEQTERSLDNNLAEIDHLTWSLLYRQPLDFLDSSLDSDYQLLEANRKFKEYVYSDLFRGRLDHIHDIYFITKDRHILSTDNNFHSFGQVEMQGFNLILKEIKEDPLKMKWFVQEIYQSKNSYPSAVRPSVTAVRKIINNNTAELSGYLAIRLNDRFFGDLLENVQVSQKGALLLTDKNGTSIYEQNKAIVQDNDYSAMIGKLPMEGSGLITVENKWLIAYANSKTSGWRLSAIVPTNDIFRPNVYMLQFLSVISITGIVILGVLSVLLAAAISKPVIDLARVMSERSIDDLYVNDTSNRILEIGILQKNFNRLMSRIQHLMKENEKEQKEKREALLHALQMQIHPHFLYNTLDTIYWMSKKHQAEPISKLVSALGKFFRHTLSAGQEWTTLQKEFEHVENYLNIQTFRYRDQFDYELVLDPALSSSIIMPLVLQPLVENALEHGIAKNEAKGLIRLSGAAAEGGIQIDVFNTAPRADVEKMYRILQDEDDHGHVGLRNVQQRIKFAFGDLYGLSFHSDDTGTTVSVLIPFEPGHFSLTSGRDSR